MVAGMVAGQIAGVGLNIAQGIMQKKAASRYIQRGKEDLDRTRGTLSSGFGDALGTLRGGLGQISQGYGLARQEVSRVGQASRRRALEGGQALQGQITSDMMRSGLGSTTALGNARRGAYGDTQRALSNIDERLASLFSGLRERETAATQSQLGAIANTQIGQTQSLGDLGVQRANLRSRGALGGEQPWGLGGQSDFSGLSTSLGSLFSSFGKGGGGGMAGAQSAMNSSAMNSLNKLPF